MNNNVLPPATQYFNKYLDDGRLEALCNQDTTVVVRFNFCNNCFTYKGMISLSRANLPSLKELMLNGNNVGGLGCKYISRAYMPSLRRLCLDRNFIDSSGMLHLSKAGWSNIQEISLVYNKIGRNGSSWLSKARWRTETEILLATNEMRMHELLLFLLYPDKYLKSADLRYHQLAPQEKFKLIALFSLKYNQTTKIFI